MKHAVVIGAALILATNAVALLGVAYNRSGEPESALVLSERELRAEASGFDEDENSGLALRIGWQAPTIDAVSSGRYRAGHVEWLGEAKLTELGFDFEALRWIEGRSYRGSPRSVFLALELDGPAHQRAIEQARRALQRAESDLAAHPDAEDHARDVEWARDQLGSLERDDSRLYAIDADLEREALRARHPDRARIAIVRARIGVQWIEHSPWGYIAGLEVSTIHVDRSRSGDASLLRGPLYPRAPSEWRGEVGVAFGRRLEPWITSLEVSRRP